MGQGQMQPVLYTDGISDDPTACDSVTVDLHDANEPYDLIESATGLLHADGTLQVLFSPSVLTHTYYVAIRSRNIVETWLKDPILFNTTTVDFDLSRN
jgi:hypothetical protein